MDPALKKELEALAQMAGRSLSAEVVFMLRRSLDGASIHFGPKQARELAEAFEQVRKEREIEEHDLNDPSPEVEVDPERDLLLKEYLDKAPRVGRKIQEAGLLDLDSKTPEVRKKVEAICAEEFKLAKKRVATRVKKRV